MVLMLGRGIYCPKDRQQLQQLVQFQAQCAVGFTRLVTITTDSFILSNDLRLGVGANWPFLHDPGRIVQKDLEIQEYTDPHNNPMIPHTFVLEPGLKIYKIYYGYWYWGRPSTAELHQDLRDITSRIRPDYKIDTPEMRQRWESGTSRRSTLTGNPGSRSSHAWRVPLINSRTRNSGTVQRVVPTVRGQLQRHLVSLESPLARPVA